MSAPTRPAILLSSPCVGPLEEEAVLRALRSGWVAPAGPELAAFEAELARQCGRQHAVALASGSAALHLALIAYGVRPGDVVCCATLTFAATVNAVRYVGAEPLLIDADDSGSMDPTLLRLALADCRRRGRRVGAVLPVDLMGKIADHTAIGAVCREYGVPHIVDAAESLGAVRDGRPAGSHGDAAVVSFNGNKIITTSGGGVFLSDDETVAARVRHLSTQARTPAAHYEHEEVGFNYRMSNVLAALGRAQLARLPDFLAARRQHREAYRAWATGHTGVTVFGGEDAGDNCWLTALEIDPVLAGYSCTDLAAELTARGIESRPMWKPMHAQPVHAGVPALLNGTSDRMFDRGIVLPSGSDLSDQQRSEVIEVMNQVACAGAGHRRRAQPPGVSRPADTFDWVVVGGGVSAAMLVDNLISEITCAGLRDRRIAVVEKAGEFWTGVPFGRRSGDQALIISDLDDFVPEAYRAEFTAYLAAEGQPSSPRSYLPRAAFGRFLARRLDRVIQEAARSTGTGVELITAEAYDCRPIGTAPNQGRRSSGVEAGPPYELDLGDRRIQAAAVVVAVGSPPQRRLAELMPALRHAPIKIVDDLYGTDFPAAMEAMNAALAAAAARGRTAQLLLVGTQASGLEVLRLLRTDLDVAVTVLSPSAEFPHPALDTEPDPDSSGASPRSPRLDRLAGEPDVTAAEITAAVAADMAELVAAGTTRSDAITVTGRRIAPLVSRLSQEQAQHFVNHDGLAIGRWHRRAGPAYRSGLERLVQLRRITFRAGRFDRGDLALATSTAGCEVISTQGRWDRVPVDVVVNAIGFTTVERSGGLLSTLCRSGLLRPTPSGAGVAVDESLQARDGLYVFGPLLAGNASGALRIWHLESVRRISTLAGRLAAGLAGRL